MSSDSLSDFPDRLPPMLVKELRQGLRAKTFVAVFLSFQAVLAVILLSASASGVSGRVGSVISGVIFTFFSIAVLVVQPLRGIGSIASEVKGNTLDMMVLTRLSASRIVYGKWFALVSQSALLLATVVPYLIFRYFLGQMNLVGEIILLSIIFMTSMAATAVTVGLSASHSVILRVIVPLIGVPVLGWLSMMMLFTGRVFGSSSLIEACALATPESRIIALVYILSILYLGWSALSLGTSIIAPAAENHTTFRRLVTFVVTVVSAAYMLLADGFENDLTGLIVALVAIPAFSIALTERSFLVPTVTAAFEKFGVIGRFAKLFLCPGWPSGVFFSLVISAIFVTGVALEPDEYGKDDILVHTLSVLGALFFPAAIVILFRVEETARVSAYLVILGGSAIFTLVILAIAESLNNEELLWFFAWMPSVLLPLEATHPDYHENLPVVSSLITGAYAFFLLTAATLAMRSKPAHVPESA